MVAVSSGTRERRSMTSASMPCSAARRSAASTALGTIAASATIVASEPARTIARRPERVDVLAVGDLALDREERLVLAEDDRVRVADRGRHQADHVGRRRRRDDLEARGSPSPSSRRSGCAAPRTGGRRRSRSGGRAAARPGRRSCSGSWRSGWRPCPRSTAKKSENISSAIGRRPVIAAPIAAPTIACSLIGVSRTRSGPNSSNRPSVSLNTPPAAPTSSPMRTTVGSRPSPGRCPATRDRPAAVGQFRHDEPPSVQTWVSRTSAIGFGRGPRLGLGRGDRGARLLVDGVELARRPRRRPRAGSR